MKRDLPNEVMMLCDSVRKFMQKEVAPQIDRIDHYPVIPAPEGFFDSVLARLGELGLLSLMVPAEFAGSGLGIGILSAVVETMAEIYASIPALLLGHSIGQSLILEVGSPAQKERWLTTDGSRGRPPVLAFPMYQEPQGQGLLRERSGVSEGEVIVEGRCDLVVNGPLADGLVLPVWGTEGMGIIVLPREAKGVTLSEPVLTLGLRACPVADILVNGVKVPREEMAVTGGPTASLEATYRIFSGPVAALCAGISGLSIEKATAYVRERRQGGRPLAEYSQVRMMIASMARRYETARLAAGRLSESGAPRCAEDLALFISARDGVARAVQDGVQLLGGYGYMEDYGQERCMRDAKQAHMLLGRDDLRCLDLAAMRVESVLA